MKSETSPEGKEKKRKEKKKNQQAMVYHRNTSPQRERKFLIWPQWPLPVLLEIRCTKLQFCLVTGVS